ncbi:substrate-binding domain-containing protein [Aerococcaceae bacterium INB8]|uniref:Substrate-binding domain-containing protein n=1 Tax=Ruoffia halotolerans TaxID=2748684 RepID=A0A839A3P3_9LACT|nr:substrate-binding domain-containing protein [Ruoffia halotolerans]MBA5728418.1 substrate-binding domain-containing protein [Ruoffia halotolerans]
MKTIKKILLAVFTLSIFNIFAFNQATYAQEEEIGELAIIIPGAEHGWLAGIAYYAELKAEELGIENYRILTSSNVNEQASQIDEVLSQEVAGVVLLPHTDELSLSAQKLVEADIPLIVFDRRVDVDYTAYVAGSNPEIGEATAEVLGEELGGAGKIAVLNNPSAGSVSYERVDAFKAVMEEKYPDIELVDMTVENFTQEEGLSVATDMLVANPELDAIFSIDDESSLGILQAIRDAGREDVQFLSGAGGSQAYFQQIADSEGINLFTATYSPSMIGDAIEEAWKILNGEDVEKDQIVSPTIVNQENVSDFLDADSPY